MKFETLHDMVQYVDKLPMVDVGFDRNAWAGGSHDDTAKLATFGWPEGAKLASEKATSIADRVVNTTGVSTHQVIEYDVIGAVYDAGAVALGMPESWGVMAPQVSKRAVRIVLNCNVSGRVPASAITARGLAVSALAVALTARGYPVTVDVWQSLGYAGDMNILTRLANASTGSQLDLDRLVYGLAHPTYFRRLCRAVTNGIRCDGENQQTGRWGHSPVTDKPPEGEPIDLYVGSAHLYDAERWKDGGEAWVIGEYLKQTGA